MGQAFVVQAMIHIPESPLLTGCEAACYLLLCSPDDAPDEIAKGVRTVNRLVQAGLLHPIKPGKSYAYAKVELDRYIVAATADFEPQENAH